MSVDLVALEFSSPTGDDLRVEWDEAALARPDPGAGDAWRLEGELDWDEVEALRVLFGRIEDGRAIAIAALRPAGADGHGDEATGGAIVAEGVVEQLAEVLLSTEYGPGSEPRRVGVELYREDGGMPMRIAGNATSTTVAVEGGVRRERVMLELRFAGLAGSGVYEILTRG